MEKKPSIQKYTSNFLKIPQEVVTTRRLRAKSLMDYSQSQNLTSNEHVDTLYTIAQKRKQLAQEKETRRIEKELIKYARTTEKQKQRETKEKKAHEKHIRMVANSPIVMTILEEVFKAKWTISACEEQVKIP